MTDGVSFIGTGNMGGALIHAACRALDPEQVHITDYLADKACAMAGELGCGYVSSNSEAVKASKYIFLCVKPQVMGSVLEEIAPVLETCAKEGMDKVVVSIAAGLPIGFFKDRLPVNDRIHIIRVMPNTPAAIGKGMLAVAAGPEVASEYVDDVCHILSDAGRVERISESLMDQFSVAGGCAPAFVYMFIEAMADGAVLTGAPRAQAVTWAAQTVLGAAAMVLETGVHPGALKDAVCSPGGSTIAGVATLEKYGFRSSVIEAVRAGYEKNLELGRVK